MPTAENAATAATAIDTYAATRTDEVSDAGATTVGGKFVFVFAFGFEVGSTRSMRSSSSRAMSSLIASSAAAAMVIALVSTLYSKAISFLTPSTRNKIAFTTNAL